MQKQIRKQARRRQAIIILAYVALLVTILISLDLILPVKRSIHASEKGFWASTHYGLPPCNKCISRDDPEYGQGGDLPTWAVRPF